MGDTRNTAWIELAIATEKSRRELKKLNGSFKGAMDTVTYLGGAIGLAFSAQRIVEFGVELSKLAINTAGIEVAFNNLNDATLLDNLTRAVKGTVSQIELMRQAVRADQFGIELNTLGTMFEFAAQRAEDLGKSTTEFVDDLIQAMGTNSKMVLDNLGISRAAMTEEMAKGMSFAEAAAKIMKDSMKGVESAELSTKQELEKLNAELLEHKRIIGKEIAPAYVEWVKLQGELLEGIPKIFSGIAGLFDSETYSVKISDENFAKLEKALMRVLTAEEKAAIYARGFNKEQKELIRNADYGAVAINHEAKAVEEVDNTPVVELNNELERTVRLAGELKKSGLPVFSTGVEGGGSVLPIEPGADPMAESKALTEMIDKLNVATDLSYMLGAGFTDALFAGENFGLVMKDMFTQLLKQMIQMVVTALALSAIMSAFGGGTFSSLFTGMFSNGFGGTNFSTVLRGPDIALSNSRQTGINNRVQ